jgi:hypothetical protein
MDNIGSNMQGGGMLHFPSPPNAEDTLQAKINSN